MKRSTIVRGKGSALTEWKECGMWGVLALQCLNNSCGTRGVAHRKKRKGPTPRLDQKIPGEGTEENTGVVKMKESS